MGMTTHSVWIDNLYYIPMVFLMIVLTGCGQALPNSSIIATVPTFTPTTQSAELVVTMPVPTAASLLYAPASTPTPIATLAPVFYTVQTGDSLIAIASRYNVSASALQDVNGILDPRSLQIGQKILIPPEKKAGLNTRPSLFPTPLPFQIQNVYFRESAIGNLLVLGEVYNDGTISLEQVRVGITLLDSEGVELTKAYELAALDLIQRSEKAPFAILINDVPGYFEQYQIYPVSAMQGFAGSYYRALEVKNLQGIESDGPTSHFASHRVGGVVRNVGNETATDVEVILTAYDALNQVIGTRTLEIDAEPLESGGEIVFMDILTLIGGPVHRVEGIAQGRQ